MSTATSYDQPLVEDSPEGPSLSNLITVASSLCILLFAFYSRLGLSETMGLFALANTFALAIVLISLPTFLTARFSQPPMWFQSDAFFTGALLLLFALAGSQLHDRQVLPAVLLWPAALGLLWWEVGRSARVVSLLGLVSGLAMVVLLTLTFYSQGFHSALFLEKLTLGEAHQDVIYHAAISNMASTTGWSSTGLDGAPYVSYHWASHALFAGLRHWAGGVSTLTFYNIGYAALFVPLFIKTLFLFADQLAELRGGQRPAPEVAVFVVAFIYSIGLAGAHPFLSESFCVSLVFTFSFLACLLIYTKSATDLTFPFCLYAVGMLLLISFTKISTGFVLCATMTYLVLRAAPNRRGALAVVLSGGIIGLLNYLFVVPTDGSSVTVTTGFARRYYNLWVYSTGFVTYFLGAMVSTVAAFGTKRLSSWSHLQQLFRSKEILDLELLLVMTLSGFGAAVVVSANPSSVYFFCTTQFFVSLGYLIVAAQIGYCHLRTSRPAKSRLLFVVVAMCLLARPGLGIPIRTDLINIRSEMKHLSGGQAIYHDLVLRLIRLDGEPDKQETCVYIAQGESWYFDAQSYRPKAAPFVVPALSGLALIGGVPDSILESDYDALSFGQYKRPDHPRIRDLEEAKLAAAQRGYKQLIHFSSLSGRLVETRYRILPSPRAEARGEGILVEEPSR